MRRLRITKEDFEQTIQVDGSVTRLTGTDIDSLERVKFKLTDTFLVNTMIAVARREGQVELTIASFQVIAVTSNPEWDSPGTSPEEDGA